MKISLFDVDAHLEHGLFVVYPIFGEPHRFFYHVVIISSRWFWDVLGIIGAKDHVNHPFMQGFSWHMT